MLLNKIKIRKITIIQASAFLINPFLSLIISLFFLLARKKISILILAMTLALIFVYLPLAPDASANFYTYLKYDEYKILFILKGFYLSFTKFINQSTGLQFMTVNFLYITSIIFIWFKVFSYYANKTSDSRSYAYMLIFVVFSIIELRITGLNRNYLAFSILLGLVYLVEVNAKKDIYFYFFLVLAILIHISSLLIILLYVIALRIRSIKVYILLPFIAFIISIFSLNILEYISTLSVMVIDSKMSTAFNYYIHDPKHGHITLKGFDLYIRVIEIPYMIVAYTMGIKLLYIKDNVTIRLSLLIIVITLFFLFMHSLYERYSIAAFIFSSFIIYQYIIFKGPNRLLVLIVSILLVARFWYLNVNNYGYIYSEEGYSIVLKNQEKKLDMILKPMYIPGLLLLNINEHGYSDSYIKEVSTYD